MMHKQDLIGKRYGKLTVIADGGQHKNRHYQSVVRCDCGNTFVTFDSHLRTGKVTQCRDCSYKQYHTKHGMTGTRIFHIWSSMKGRCYNKNNKEYARYGGRGIEVCNEWLGEDGFTNFNKWAVANGYSDSLTIDRIDVNGNYEPGNCRWATTLQQARNKRNTNYVEYNKKTISVREAAELCGIDAQTIIFRLKSGWSDYDATHIKPKSYEAYKNSKGDDLGKIAIITNKKTGDVHEFKSYSAASRFLGHNNGYIHNRISKFKSHIFETGEYIVEATEQSYKLHER